ncbi:MAG: hypothetical protein CMK92_02760 [Pseudomonas sp.]|nr:hypothetical protein [Pseudomonas sp.]
MHPVSILFLSLLVVIFAILLVVCGFVLYFQRYDVPVEQQELSDAFKQQKFDVVYLWVDGLDPEFQKRRFGSVKSASESCRYADNGELEYSVAMTRRYLGDMVNHTYIVTQQQTPKWYDPERDTDITIVDHRDIMGDLVTFQSGVIELFLHKIPGIGEWVLYFNDDIFVNQPIDKEVLFYADNKPRFMYDGWGISPLFANVMTLNQEPVAASLRYTEKIYIRNHPEHKNKHHSLRSHGPLQIHVPTLAKIAEANIEHVEETKTHTTRCNNDFMILTYYLMYMVDNEKGAIGNNYPVRYVFINNMTSTNRMQMNRAFQDKNTYFICLNDSRTANFEKTTKGIRDTLRDAYQSV